MQNLTCPNCGNINDPEQYIACDNDCDTYFCDLCDEPYYFKNNKAIHGHNPICGYESDGKDEL